MRYSDRELLSSFELWLYIDYKSYMNFVIFFLWSIWMITLNITTKFMQKKYIWNWTWLRNTSNNWTKNYKIVYDKFHLKKKVLFQWLLIHLIQVLKYKKKGINNNKKQKVKKNIEKNELYVEQCVAYSY